MHAGRLYLQSAEEELLSMLHSDCRILGPDICACTIVSAVCICALFVWILDAPVKAGFLVR